MKEKKKINKVILLLQLISYLIAGWFIFSIQGYLPKVLSLPIPESKQKHNSIFYVSGNSYVNDVIINYNEDVVEPKVMEKLDIFTNNNIDGTDGYYDKDENKYYISTPKYVYECDANTAKVKELSSLYSADRNGVEHTPVKYKNMIFKLQTMKYPPYIVTESKFRFKTKEMDNLLYRYGSHRDEKNELIIDKDINFKGISDMLVKNETENISLKELTFLLWISRCKILLGWYPETQTTIYFYSQNNQNYIAKYTVGKEVEKYPINLDEENMYMSRFDEENVLIRNKSDNTIYVYNFITGEKRDIVTTPNISNFRYRINENKKLIILGLTDNLTVWVYDEERGKTEEHKTRTDANTSVVIGTDGFYVATAEKNSEQYNRGTFFDIAMYKEEGE